MLKVIKFRERETDLVSGSVAEARPRVSTGLFASLPAGENEAHWPSSMGDRDGLDLLFSLQ